MGQIPASVQSVVVEPSNSTSFFWILILIDLICIFTMMCIAEMDYEIYAHLIPSRPANIFFM